MNRLLLDIEPELLFFGLQLSLELLVGPPDRLDREETINLLKRDTAGLRDEEKGEEEGEEGQGSEEEVYSVSHGFEHLFGEAGDEEVKEPVTGGCEGLGQRTEAGLEEFLLHISESLEHSIYGETHRIDDPWSTVPGGCVDSSPHIEEEDCGNATTVEVVARVVRRVHDVDVCTNDPHTDGTGNTTDQKKLPSSELIDKEQQPDDRHNSLDDTEDTSQDVAGVGLHTDTLQKEGQYSIMCELSASGPCAPCRSERGTDLENGGRVVVDGVDTGSVLPEEEHAAEEQTPHQVRTSGKGLKGLPETETDGRLLVLMGLIDGSNFFGDIDIGSLQLADPAEVLHGLAALVVKEKPARGLAHPQGTNEQQTGWDDLHSKRNEPLLMIIR